MDRSFLNPTYGFEYAEYTSGGNSMLRMLDHPSKILVCGVILWPCVSIAETRHVPSDHPTIQACIEAAVNGDECIVAPGIHNETINFLGKAITLRSSDGRDVTVIDGTGLASTIVTCASGEGPDTVLDGFTITGGRGPYVPLLDAYAGGGMLNLESSPTVTRCTFENNRVSSFSPPYKYSLGGGMCNVSSSPTVTDCRFKNNEASNSPVDHPGWGGGMYNYESSPIVSHCEFSGNTAVGGGGGMFNESSNIIVTGCTFIANVGFFAAGGILDSSGSLVLSNSLIVANHTGFSGAVLSLYATQVLIGNCTIAGNSATQRGGAISAGRETQTALVNSIIWGNVGLDGSQIDLGSTATEHPAMMTVDRSDVQYGIDGITGVGTAVWGDGNIDVGPAFVRTPSPGPDGRWNGIDDDHGDLRLQAGSPCINAGDPDFAPTSGEADLDGHARVLCGRVDMGAYEFGIGDYDCNQEVELQDFAGWPECMAGPGQSVAPACASFDFNADGDVDLADFQQWQRLVLETGD